MIPAGPPPAGYEVNYRERGTERVGVGERGRPVHAPADPVPERGHRIRGAGTGAAMATDTRRRGRFRAARSPLCLVGIGVRAHRSAPAGQRARGDACASRVPSPSPSSEGRRDGAPHPVVSELRNSYQWHDVVRWDRRSILRVPLAQASGKRPGGQPRQLGVVPRFFTVDHGTRRPSAKLPRPG